MTEVDVEAAAKASQERQNKVNLANQRALRDVAKAHPEEFDSAVKQHALDLGVELPAKRKSKEERDADTAAKKKADALAAVLKKVEGSGLTPDEIVAALDAQ